MAESASQRQSTPPAAPDLVGESVGRFVVRARLGKGGMGEVYLADDTALHRSVALKRIPPSVGADERYRRRLWAEARCASCLTDPHIAGVYDAFEHSGELFIVMEYVEGQTLRHRLRQPMPLPKFLEIAEECASGLAAAHSRGVIHRDIKPENIMLTPSGHVKILDFGVARRLPEAGDTSTDLDARAETGELGGTWAYMSPEVLDEGDSDGRADIFSLGVVFYETLAGAHPFCVAGFLATCNRILRIDPAPLHSLNPEVPAELERIVGKMLAKDPAERYSSAADLVVDLRALRKSLVQHVFDIVPPPWSRHLGKRVAAFAVAIASLAVLAVLLYRYVHKPVFSARDWMLVTDFANHTDQPIFDATVTESLRDALQQSRYVHIVPRGQAAEAARRTGRSDVSHLNASLGREICQREDFRALLAGEITKAGSGYQISVQVVDPWRDAPVFTDRASLHSTSELYSAVDTLAKQLRAHLGESLAQIAKESTPLAKVTTLSLEALQRYSRSMELYAEGDMQAFLPLARSAVEIDPDFAMAHLYLARALDWLGDSKGAQQEMQEARRNLGHVTEEERYLILATDNELRGLYEKAAEQYRLLTELYPDDLEGYRGLAEASFWSGRSEDGVAAVKHALQLDPKGPSHHHLLIIYLDRLNRFSEALADFQSAQALQVKNPRMHWGAGLAYLGLGNASAARQEFDLLGKEGGPSEQSLSVLFTAKVLMYEGRLREATDALHSGLILGQKLHSETWIPGERYLLTQVFYVRGQVSEARGEMRRLALLANAQLQEQELRRGGLMAVQLADLKTARQLSARLAALIDERDSGYARSCYHNLEGALALATGQANAAIESQRRAALFFPSYQAQLGLGKSYAAQEQWRSSAESYRRYLNFKGEIFDDDSPADWVLAHLALARVFAKAGETQQALQFYNEFLRLWAHADADLQVLQAARTEHDQLAKTVESSSAQGSSRVK